MACQVNPTGTRIDELVGQTVFQTVVPITTTAPGEVVTSAIPTAICSTNTTAEPPETTCVSSTILSTMTLPGDVITETVTQETTLPVTSTTTVTLFTTSCPPNVPPPPPSSSSPLPSSTPFSSTSQSYLSSTPSSASASQTSSTPSALASDSAQNQGKGTNVGPIVGGAVGGFVGLVALVMLTWFLFKKGGGRFDKVFNGNLELDEGDKQEYGRPFEKPPTGYQYNLLGHENGNPTGHGNPHSPPPPANNTGYGGQFQDVAPPQSNNFSGPYQDTGFQGGNFQDSGYQGGNFQDAAYQPNHNNLGGGGDFNAYGPTDGQHFGPAEPQLNHARNPSLTPLLVGVGAAAGASSAHAALATPSSRPSTMSNNSGRPSTSGSMQPLVQHQGYQGQQQQHHHQGPHPHNHSHQQPHQQTHYPPAGYPPQVQGQGQLSPPHGYTYPPSTNLSHSVSTGSVGTTGAASSMYNSFGQHMVVPPPVVPTIVGGSHHHSRPSHSHTESVSGRSGSPVSFQEQRVLQVANPETRYDIGGSSAGAGSSSMAAAGGSSSAAAAAAAAFPVDGKGRPVNLKGEKAPMVHLDGGRYEEPLVPLEGTTQPASGLAPPAYSPS